MEISEAVTEWRVPGSGKHGDKERGARSDT